MSHQHKSTEGFDLTLDCDVESEHRVWVTVHTYHGEMTAQSTVGLDLVEDAIEGVNTE